MRVSENTKKHFKTYLRSILWYLWWEFSIIINGKNGGIYEQEIRISLC